MSNQTTQTVTTITELLTSLNLADLRRISDARARVWNKGKPASLAFAMMELAGETGEACNVAKKHARQEMGWVGGSTDTEALADELADVIICADLAAQRAGIDLAAAVIRKFNKTSEKHGFPHRLPTPPTPEQPSAESQKPITQFHFDRSAAPCSPPQTTGESVPAQEPEKARVRWFRDKDSHNRVWRFDDDYSRFSAGGPARLTGSVDDGCISVYSIREIQKLPWIEEFFPDHQQPKDHLPDAGKKVQPEPDPTIRNNQIVQPVQPQPESESGFCTHMDLPAGVPWGMNGWYLRLRNGSWRWVCDLAEIDTDAAASVRAELSKKGA